jgi:hypothetical protein
MKTKNIALLTSLIGFASLSASAQNGTLPAGNDFAGSGIPIDTVEVTTITQGGDTITLGLDATQRNPSSPIVNNGDLYNNGSATYFAAPGEQWNFDFYAGITGGVDLSDYTFSLSYAVTPGTPAADLGTLNLGAGSATPVQNSEYPGFGFLTSGAFGAAPASPYDGPYNSAANGDYDFVLNAYYDGSLIGSDDITVQVGNVPDAISTLSLLGIGLGALVSLRRRFNRA